MTGPIPDKRLLRRVPPHMLGGRLKPETRRAREEALERFEVDLMLERLGLGRPEPPPPPPLPTQ